MGLFHDYDADDRTPSWSETASLSSLMSESDRTYAYGLGESRPTAAWVLSDRDVWYRNPSYRAPEYAIVATYDRTAGFFRQWEVAAVSPEGQLASLRAGQHTSPLAAWRQLRYLQELDALLAETHPESAGELEPGDMEVIARSRVSHAHGNPMAAGSPYPLEPTDDQRHLAALEAGSATLIPDPDDDIPF